MKWLNFWGLFLGLCASFLVTTESHAQLEKLLGGGKDDGGGGLGGLLGGGKDDGAADLVVSLAWKRRWRRRTWCSPWRWKRRWRRTWWLLDNGGSGGGLSNPMGLIGDAWSQRRTQILASWTICIGP